MAKLHELLAVAEPLKQQADKTRGDLANTFEKKRHLFGEKVVTFVPSTEGAENVREEQSDLQSTVHHELEWIAGIWSKALDAAYDIADANTHARADVVLDNGKVLLKNVPATALLELEKRAEEIRELVAGIPTLDPAKGFKPDPTRGEHIYIAREHNATRTKKTMKAFVLYEATDKHPAQVKEMSEDVPVGTIKTQEWSGLITPADKAKILDRAEQFKRAVKQARSRANGYEVTEHRKIGEPIFAFVFNGTTNAEIAEPKK